MEYSSTPPEGERYVVNVERRGNTKYTYYNDGVIKITRFKKKKIYWGRIAVAVLLLFLLILGIVQIGKSISKSKKSNVTSKANTFIFDSEESASAETADKPAETPTAKAPSADDSSSKAEAAEPQTRELIVCIDPGHGDIDLGNADGDGNFEKDQVLEVALMVRDRLTEKGVTVVMTRESDTQISRTDRCTLANTSGADLCVSIHRGGGDSVYFYGTSGVIAWVNDHRPVYDTTLAQNILNALDEAGVSQDHGVYYGYDGAADSNYEINMSTVMPSCQIELGSMLCADDNQLFISNKEAYADAIANAVIKTGVDLGVIAEDGTRKLGEQLISEGKNSVTVNSQEQLQEQTREQQETQEQEQPQQTQQTQEQTTSY